ncbi:hypothetical protein [Limimaricola litoreus]|uniref:Uncharacterized protein n=1 Tax=Limimaricola litoreus TaxID=2955316 RepID=A0A9X2FVT4_9RHOB|nr:hypothetical protein [Limimaricola litoreus]MCP1169371.1 hypothetical protein [Limimaricola litoreus]
MGKKFGKGSGTDGGASGSEVSLRRSSQDYLVQRQVRDQWAQALVLLLELLQPLQLAPAHASVLSPPSVVALLRDPDLVHRIGNRHTLAVQHLERQAGLCNVVRLASILTFCFSGDLASDGKAERRPRKRLWGVSMVERPWEPNHVAARSDLLGAVLRKRGALD